MSHRIADVKGRDAEIPLQTVENHWYTVFRKYDTDGDGKLSLRELRTSLTSSGFTHDIPDRAVVNILKLADENQDGHIDFQEFIKLLETEEGKNYARHLMSQYIRYTIPQRSRKVASPDSTDGDYEDEYSCFPPPICMVVMSTIEIAIFAFDISVMGESIMWNFGPAAELFIYNPHKRAEIWRFLTYMFVHSGVSHLLVNLAVQIMLGLPLEMVHRWWRVLIIYLAGVVAGSLGTSYSDPNVYLAGASGGVYAIISAHLSTIILNWSEMQFAVLQLVIFLALAVVDVGSAIYTRYFEKLETQIGYVAHLAGAGAGLLVGFYILRNLEVHSWERKLKWAGIIIYITLVTLGIFWNVFSTSAE